MNLFCIDSGTYVYADVAEKVVEEHVRLGPSGSAGCAGERRLFGRSVLLDHGRGL